MWPRLLRRDLPAAAVALLESGHTRSVARSIRKLYDAWELGGEKKLSWSFARSLLTAPKHQTLPEWLDELPAAAGGGEAGERVAAGVQELLEPAETPLAAPASGGRTPDSLTFDRTATRPFETSYWKTIAFLAEGKYRNKNNADCVKRSGHGTAAVPRAPRPGGAGRLPAGLLHEDDRSYRFCR